MFSCGWGKEEDGFKVKKEDKIIVSLTDYAPGHSHIHGEERIDTPVLNLALDGNQFNSIYFTFHISTIDVRYRTYQNSK
jgi:hypothetical protein